MKYNFIHFSFSFNLPELKGNTSFIKKKFITSEVGVVFRTKEFLSARNNLKDV